MEIAILVFFLAIFGGVLFLLALVWYIFRRVRKLRQPGRHFSGSKGHGGHSGSHHDSMDSDDNDAAFLAGSAMFSQQDSDNRTYAESAQDAAPQSENSFLHDKRDFSTAPAEPNYSSYDSGSSYESSSSYDSGSSSGDSGSSSSSSSSD